MAGDVGPFTELSLFTGYGGFTLGLRLAGVSVQTVCYVEKDKYCQQIIQQRIAEGFLDDAPLWDDITTFDGGPWSGHVDIVTGGFPCQPHSVAGQRRGEADERNLWPETLRVVRDVGSKFVLLENVPGILADPGYAGTVVGQLAESGYDCLWGCVPAAAVGARTSVGAGGALPTPRSTSGGGNRSSYPNAPYRLALAQAAQRWPTPRAGKTTDEDEETWLARQAEGKVSTPPLALAVKMWPTPTFTEGSGVNPQTGKGGGLSKTVNWATPKGTPSGPDYARREREGSGGDDLTEQLGGQLNPTWVEWLMGLPLGWVSLEPLATESYQQWSRSF